MNATVRLISFVRPYRGRFLAGLGCAVATTAISLVGPRVLQYGIDDLTTGVTAQKLALYGGALLAVGIVGGFFRFLMRRILIGASRHIEYDLRNAFFAHLEALPVSYFQANRTGDLMSRATNDLNAVRMMIGPAVMYAGSTVLGFVSALSLMLAIDAKLTLLALIPLPVVSLSVWLFGRSIHDRSEAIQEQLATISAVVQEALSGVRVIRAYRQEQSEIERFQQANREYLRRSRRLIVLQGMFFPSMGFFLGLGAMVVLWIGSREVIAGRITLGQFVAFNAYLTMLSWPMIAFGWVTNMLQRGMASWGRMLAVLDASPAAVGGREPVPPDGYASRIAAVRGELVIRDLTFGYGNVPVLRGISATIPAGHAVAIVGSTGAGKSTLISLLTRLFDPPPGTIFLDGVDICTLPLPVLRGSIGVVPQEPFLFSDSLANNVAFGADAAVLADTRGPAFEAAANGSTAPGPADGDLGRFGRIQAAAAIARLDKDVAEFPKGYETMVGERGITLSGGQKQRTALARAVMTDPRILILDDALSAVDTYTEEEILLRLRDVVRQRTSIVVSHRISTVRGADQILVLDQGRVAERGTHAELVAHDGLYASLHRRQLLEEELAAS